MRFAEDDNDGLYRVRSYAPGEIRINDEVFTRSLVISPEQLIRDWPPQRLEDLTHHDMESLAAMQPEVILIGTGARMHFPPASLIAGMQARGIGVEVMDTAAACRTYNILVSESRQVTAVLLMI